VPASNCRVSLHPLPNLAGFHKLLYFGKLFVYLLLRVAFAGAALWRPNLSASFTRAVAACENLTN
jgi:hypothetical protein